MVNKMKIGDLVWCQNGISKNMGAIESRDPSYPDDPEKPLQPDDYVWVVLLEGNSMGQKKWAQIKNLEVIGENR